MQPVTEEGGNGLVSSLTGCCLDGEKLKSGLIHSQAAKGHGQVDGLGPPHADLLPCETSASWNVPVCQSCHRNTEQSRKPCREPETEANLGRQAVTTLACVMEGLQAGLGALHRRQHRLPAQSGVQ